MQQRVLEEVAIDSTVIGCLTADAASDVAVGGSVDGQMGENVGTQNAQVGPVPEKEAATAVSGDIYNELTNEDDNMDNIAAKNTNYHTRAPTIAEVEDSPLSDMCSSLGLENIPSSGISLMNMPVGNNSNETRGEGHSVPSLGINFNFGPASLHLSSCDGDEARKQTVGGHFHNWNGQNMKPHVRTNSNPIHERGGEPKVSNVNSSNGCDKSGKGSGAHCKTKNIRKPNKCIFPSDGAEEGSAGSSSDSSKDYNSGGSSNSGSGNDQSSGGKSTVSSLTTSSNQGWMVTDESKAIASTADAAAGQLKNNARTTDDGFQKDKADVHPQSTNINENISSGNKRKKAPKLYSQGMCRKEGNGADNDADSTGGYNTDEEQWGVKRYSDGNLKDVVRSTAAHVHHHARNKISNTSLSTFSAPACKDKGLQVQEVRYSRGQLPDASRADAHPSTGISPQRAISSCPQVTADPAVTFFPERIPLSSTVTAAVVSASQNMISAPPPQASPDLVHSSSKRKSSGNHHSATLDPRKREERNAREKERSCRIAKQIDDLRAMLSRGGVIVAKGTKSSVLSEAANYINILQQRQVQWEIDRQALIQQVQEVGSNVMPIVSENNSGYATTHQQENAQSLPLQNGFNSICASDYKFVFNTCSIGMAIASMGGAFVDCNENFCKLSEYTKEEVCSMTIFNMISRSDLQHAFDLISQMITPTLDSSKRMKSHNIYLRGAMKNGTDLGLSISLIKSDNMIARCFCVTLVHFKSTENFHSDKLSLGIEFPQVTSKKLQSKIGYGTSPAYTTG